MRVHSALIRQQGFSIVEVLVSVTSGMLLTAAAITFVVKSLQINVDTVKVTRLMSELRAVMDVVERELKRAGYDENAIASIGTGAAYKSPFARMRIVAGDSGCVLYAYDRAGGTPGTLDLSNSEIHGLRRIVLANGRGAVEYNMGVAGATPACNAASGTYTAFPPACNAGSGWCPLTDPRTVDITTFAITPVEGGGAAAGSGVMRVATTGAPELAMRDITVQLAGQLSSDNAVVRTINNRVRVRTDCVRASADFGECSQTPGT